MKTPRKRKKDVNVNIDTPNLDASFQKDSEGNVQLDIDSKHVDISVKKTDDKLSIEVEIDDKKVYEFESNGTVARLPKGMVYKVSGAILKLFLQKGFGKLKK